MPRIRVSEDACVAQEDGRAVQGSVLRRSAGRQHHEAADATVLATRRFFAADRQYNPTPMLSVVGPVTITVISK